MRQAICFAMDELTIADRANLWIATEEGNLPVEQIEQLRRSQAVSGFGDAISPFLAAFTGSTGSVSSRSRAKCGIAYRPHTLELLFHCRPAFLQSALVKGWRVVT